MSLEKAIQDLKTTLTTTEINWEQLHQTAGTVIDEAQRRGTDAYDSTLQELTALIIETAPSRLGRASMVGIACGALVEIGGDPLIALNALTDGLQKALIDVVPFLDACHQAANDATKPVDPRAGPNDSDVKKYGHLFYEEMPDGADALPAVDFFTRPMLATLCHSADARQKTKLRPKLAEYAAQVQGDFAILSWLLELLKVLDNEQLIVLHPESRRGYRILISGIGVNFDLHVLLMDALIGNPADGWIAGNRPPANVIASVKDENPAPGELTVTGQFNLLNWTGLQPDGTLNSSGLASSRDESRHWIWNEGVPEDIIPLDGTRIVLIGKPPYTRSWNGGRRFPTMQPSLKIIEKLSPQDYQKWIDRIVKASS